MSATEVATMRGVEDDLWWYRALRGEVVASIKPARPRFELLDAGCGTGGMLARVHEHFPEAQLTGVDYSEQALAFTAKRNTGAALVHGSVDELSFDDARFDFLLSLDVMSDGGVDETAALRQMYRVLKPGGAVLVNLPAFEFLRGSHDAAVNTARRFTRPQLRQFLQSAGFRIERCTYWNMMLVPAIAAIRWASRGRAQQPSVRSDLKPIWPPLNAALLGLTRLEFALSRLVPLPFGTSLFAVARK